ncbi:hypothetical protein LCGC14_3138760, partial [marine sediment metagenome]
EFAWRHMQALNRGYESAGEEFAAAMHVDAKDWKIQSVRSDLKKSLVGEIAFHTKIREGVVAEFISSWATSSSDANSYSLAMQAAASQLFNIPMTDFIRDSWNELKMLPSVYWNLGREDEQGDPQVPKKFMVMDATQILRHVYERTQEWLKERGITKVTLGRGQNWSGDEVPPELGGVDLSDEDWEVLYNMRLNQYTRQERAALAKIEEDWIPSRQEEMRDRIKTMYATEREGLREALNNDTVATIARIAAGETRAIEMKWKNERRKILEEHDYATVGEITGAARAELNRIDLNMMAAKQAAYKKMRAYSQWEGEADFHQNPLSSWSINHETALDFSL